MARAPDYPRLLYERDQEIARLKAEIASLRARVADVENPDRWRETLTRYLEGKDRCSTQQLCRAVGAEPSDQTAQMRIRDIVIGFGWRRGLVYGGRIGRVRGYIRPYRWEKTKDGRWQWVSDAPP